MSVRQLWEGSDSAKWLKELDGKTKLIVLFSFAILTIVIDNPRTLFILFTASIGLHLVGKTSLQKLQVLALLLLLGLWGSMFSQALFFSQTPRTPLFTIISPGLPILGTITEGLFVYKEGLIYGAVQGLRSATMLSIGLLVCWSSDPRQLLKALVSWKMIPQVAFMLVTAIRFLPVLVAEASEVLVALRLRSNTKIGRNSIIRHLPYIAKPLLARCLRRAQTLALSVVSRGFFLDNSSKYGYKWSNTEKIFSWTLILLVVLISSFKLVYIASEYGFYYGDLRIIYDWTKIYL